MESGKIPLWVWALAGVVVIAMALLARRNAGGGATGAVLVQHPASDAAIASEGETDRARVTAQLGAFQTLAGAISGISVADTVAQRDIGVTSLTTQAVSYGAALDSITRQTEAGYGYWNTLAEQDGETQRSRIGAERDITLGTIAADLARVLGFRQAESDDLYTREQFGAARYIADTEAESDRERTRAAVSIANEGFYTDRYRTDSDERLGFGRQRTDVEIAKEVGQTTRYAAKKAAGNWFDKFIGGFGQGLGRLFG